ncbi:hypothetical protein JQ557_14325 [Bradyrhizobium sp. U87765 SZCCT0131]|uniref:hypothetical protein n=1 Tax=unclassified Bradyrhizobium TaxID=2631580 RepID=UPI001BA883AA|nr:MULTISPECIES: hypothetical protein [unclassified Bradyrhizobium]MBR1219176.1 hypothetical protein [Bradyrhizobium sp. U87765 SZCCT0131]MBR1261827.1 hypothetical protein [Bradyrhizobium sp. U87765 SZCCT0134]MBR1306320.1 hypothetical protein [Bradyrhizobium sp. U87765 SZCCT0110]MBR1317609.1 hypothetical protein [Bradyrhizobium sp. U87765 SZCCT0109]MBR1351311.1 hypothetical protein [Bradyrhizobium sp. U87765 SZCCT0048]
MSKTLGAGIYTAYRQNGILHVKAVGWKPTAQTKVYLEQLPFLIFPPQVALIFETEGITSPVELPFETEKAFPGYPASAKVVTVVDRNGHHAIQIDERPATAAPLMIGNPAEPRFVVYRQIGTDLYLIAPADAPVIAIYVRVFGPDTYAACQAYVAAHSAPPPVVELLPGSLHAWIDAMPGGPARLVVTVDAFVEVDWTVTLVSAVPQGINPLVKLLRPEVQLPPGPVHSHAIGLRTLRYEEPQPLAYTDVTIENGLLSLSAKVTTTH